MFSATILNAQQSRNSWQIEDKPTAAVIIYNPYGNLNAQESAYIKSTINDIIVNGGKYQLIDRNYKVDVQETVLKEGVNPFYNIETCIALGQMTGTRYLVGVAILKFGNNLKISCSLIDAKSGITIKNKDSEFKSKDPDVIILSAKEAAYYFAENPDKFLAEVIKIRTGLTTPPTPPVKNPFRIKMPRVRNGFSMQGAMRNYQTKDLETGVKQNGNMWNSSPETGVLAGFTFDNYFWPKVCGLGIRTGLYGGYYFYNGTLDDGLKVSSQEVTLHIPLQAIFRFDITENVGLFATFGVAADIGIYGRISEKGEDHFFETRNPYDNKDLPQYNRFNYGLKYGVGIQLKGLMIDVSMMNGMHNLSNDEQYSMFRNSNVQVALTFMFGRKIYR